jgi:hypothetical protein
MIVAACGVMVFDCGFASLPGETRVAAERTSTASTTMIESQSVKIPTRVSIDSKDVDRWRAFLPGNGREQGFFLGFGRLGRMTVRLPTTGHQPWRSAGMPAALVLVKLGDGGGGRLCHDAVVVG